MQHILIQNTHILTPYLLKIMNNEIHQIERAEVRLINASAIGDLMMVDGLLTNIADIDPSYYYNGPLGLAASNGHIDVVKRLLQDPRVTKLSSLEHVLTYGMMDRRIRQLIKAKKAEVENSLIEDSS